MFWFRAVVVSPELLICAFLADPRLGVTTASRPPPPVEKREEKDAVANADDEPPPFPKAAAAAESVGEKCVASAETTPAGGDGSGVTPTDVSMVGNIVVLWDAMHMARVWKPMLFGVHPLCPCCGRRSRRLLPLRPLRLLLLVLLRVLGMMVAP